MATITQRYNILLGIDPAVLKLNQVMPASGRFATHKAYPVAENVRFVHVRLDLIELQSAISDRPLVSVRDFNL